MGRLFLPGAAKKLIVVSGKALVAADPTKRVTKLSLYHTRSIDKGDTVDFFLESSLFLPFEELQKLRLNQNFIKGFNGVLKLNKLRMLDLSYNLLTEIPSLSGVESLKFLSLTSNDLKIFLHIPRTDNFEGPGDASLGL
ncbi:hypothetical protein HAX54_004832 [Datura stramonium]|uniref:Uncharacterized protein n=1 Tax=Datura stramonium TaxID=4076 RepID=A0ABS8T7N1_DATST|nr:hypothetical protein [Datura stramonium]